jgi:sensor histidine kinase YesM
MLEVLVTDDGPGVVDASPAGIGLSNTRARLDQLYGRDSTFELETRPGGGACAVVRIPFRECVAS